MKVIHELLNVFLLTQVITPWKEILDLEFVIQQAIVPKIFAETGFCGQLSVIREVIVPLLAMHLIYRALLVSYVILEVKVSGVRPTGHTEIPTELLHATLHVWFY